MLVLNPSARPPGHGWSRWVGRHVGGTCVQALEEVSGTLTGF